MEWIWLRNICWTRWKDQISKLNAVIWQAIHEMEMEVTQEVREILSYNTYNS